jgi:hypothetical protein
MCAAAIAGVALFLTAAGDAYAEMYRWRDPQTGTTKYSNVPPPWYRRGEGGPSVQVIVDGKPVDRPPPVAGGVARPTAQEAAAATGPAALPATASGPQIASVLIEALGVRELLIDTSRTVESAIGTAPAWSRASPQAREQALRAARTSFVPDKLVMAMSAALASEVDATQMRAYYEARRQPIAQRMAALERERMRMLSGPDGLAAPGTRQATPVRVALVEELERVSGVSDLATMTVATTQAVALAAIPRTTPVDVEYEFERTRATVTRDLRPRIVAALQFVYDPATDDELREYVQFNQRPEVARVRPAIARAYGKALAAGFNEWFGALSRTPHPPAASVQGNVR